MGWESWQYCGDGLLGCVDEASESWEERGELVLYGYSEFEWIRACVKAGLLDDPDYPNQQKWKPKKKKEWKLHVECTSNLGQ